MNATQAPRTLAGRPRPVLIAMSFLAGLQALTTAAGFTETVPPDVALWLVLGLAAVQAGVQFYVEAQVTPVSDPLGADGTPLVPVEGHTGYQGRHRPAHEEDTPTVLGTPTGGADESVESNDTTEGPR